MTKYRLVISAKTVAYHTCETLEEAIVFFGLTEAEIIDDFAFQWYEEGDRSYAKEIIPV